jgi:hypothetical protein
VPAVAQRAGDHATLAQELLGDAPAGIVDALKAAIRAGAAPADLGRSRLRGGASGGALRQCQ